MNNSKEIRIIVAKMVQKLVSEYAPIKVILFGSHVTGSPALDSDIDLLIIKETSALFIDRWTAVQKILSGTHHGIPVETLVLTPAEIEKRLAVGDQFIAEILEKGEILYAAEGVALPS